MKKVFAVMLAMAGMTGFVLGEVGLEQLTSQEAGYRAATHKVEVEWSYLTESAANVAQTNTLTLTGPLAWSFAGWECGMPFDDVTAYDTNGLATTTNSILMTVSIGSQALVSAVQVAADQFRTYKAVMPTALSIAMTGLDATNTITATGTWPYSGVVTNGATATLTWITGAPGAGSYLNRQARGSAALFLRIWR